MPEHDDEQSDETDLKSEDDFDRVMKDLEERVFDFAEDHELPVGALSPLLVELAIKTRMTDYMLSVEKPSGSGLKLELDRMHRDFGDALRYSKRDADNFVAEVKEGVQRAARQIADAREDDEPEINPKP